MSKLTTIEGVGDVMARKFKAAGVGSCEALLEQGCTAAGRKVLAEATGIDAGRLLRFVNHADLMRLNGVGGEYAELLEAAGVDTVVELARRNAANLHARMAEVNAERRLVRQLPPVTRVAAWVAQAGTLPRRVSH